MLSQEPFAENCCEPIFTETGTIEPCAASEQVAPSDGQEDLLVIINRVNKQINAKTHIYDDNGHLLNEVCAPGGAHACAKYFLLITEGVSPGEMALVVGKNIETNKPCAALRIYSDNAHLYIDNKSDKVIREADYFKKFTPLYYEEDIISMYVRLYKKNPWGG